MCLNILTLGSTTWINGNKNLCSVRQLCVSITRFFVDLNFNIDERYIDKEILHRQFVIRRFSDESDVELHVYDKVDGINRTSMLLRMSAVTEINLLAVMGEETSKDEFGKMLISLALSSEVGRKVIIQLTLSDMSPNSPFVMNVIPKGKFSIKSNRDDDYDFADGNIFCVFLATHLH